MALRVTEKQMAAVLRLDGPARYARFVRVVADTEEVWGLWDEGWASCTENDGTLVLPLWPAREYALACAVGGWAVFLPRPIPLAELLGEMAPTMKERGIAPGVFLTPAGRGVVPTWEELEAALREELTQYE